MFLWLVTRNHSVSLSRQAKKRLFLNHNCRSHSISKHVTNPYPEPDCLLWICRTICDETSKFFLLKCLHIWKYPWNFLLFKYFKNLIQNNTVQHRLWQNICVRENWDWKYLNIYFFEHFPPPHFPDLQVPCQIFNSLSFLRHRPQLAKLSPQLCSHRSGFPVSQLIAQWCFWMRNAWIPAVKTMWKSSSGSLIQNYQKEWQNISGLKSRAQNLVQSKQWPQEKTKWNTFFGRQFLGG